MLEAIGNTSSAAFDRAGKQYDEDTDLFHAQVAYPKVLELLQADAGALEELSVLDVGCGSGRLVRLLIEHGAQAEGIDHSAGQIARGFGLPLKHGHMGILPFPDESFAAVVSYHALNNEAYENQGATLREMYRVLAPNGILVLGTFHLDSTKAEEPIVVDMDGTSVSLYPKTKDGLKTLCENAGFFFLRDEAPICTPDEQLLVRKEIRRFIIDRPYAQFIVCLKA